MPGLRIELSPPEAVERFRDVAQALLEWEKGELSAELRQRLAGKAWDLGVHPLDRDAVLAEVTALPAIQALRRLSRGDIEQLAERARQGDATALAKLRQQAEAGHADAQCELGLMYDNGEGVPEDKEEAVKWYRLAAEQGNTDAELELELIAKWDASMDRDYEEALALDRLYEEALKLNYKNQSHGQPSHKKTTSLTESTGSGVPEALARLLRQQAEKGNAAAQNDLGWMYEKGRGVPQDDSEAAKWYRLAAKQGNASAKTALDRIQKKLGQLSRQETKPLTRPVAGQAETLLADRYRDNGDGTVTDVRTGLQWMRFSLGQEWKSGACVGEGKSYEWQEAMDAAMALNRQGGYAGHQDWRVPTKEELQTLIYCSSGQPKTWNDTGGPCEGDYEYPTIYQPAFPNTPDWWYYWSSSAYADSPAGAWRVSFDDGGVDDANCEYHDECYVRLVRGGQK